MEEQLTSLLTSTLQNVPSSKVDITILDDYYKLFDEKKYLGNNFEKIYDDMEEAYNVELQSLRYRYRNSDEQIIYQNLILAVINETDAKKKLKLIPLIIYLDNKRVLYDHLYQINYFTDFDEKIKNFFVDTVKGSDVKVKNIDQLPQYHQEKEWYTHYKTGIENLNIKQIYSFVEGFERGMGFDFDIYINFLTFMTYKYFFDDLVDISNHKKDMFEILYMIDILTIEETLNLAIHSNNYLLKFAAIRKAVYFQKNNYVCLNLLKNERELLCNLILELSKEESIWKQFLEYYLEYPLPSPQLFRPLSEAIIQLDNDRIDMLLQSTKIDKFLDDDSKEALNSCFLSIENDEIQKYCLEILFQRWKSFIDTSNDYFGSIVLTDIIDLVIVYSRDFLDENEIVKKVEQVLYDLDEIDNKWFIDSSEQSNYFYKQMSKLFVFSFAFEKYDLGDLKRRVFDICSNNTKLKKEQKINGKTTLQFFNEYIFEGGNND